MRRRASILAGACATSIVLSTAPAWAAPLDPTAYKSLGTLSATNTTITIDESNSSPILEVNGASLNPTKVSQGTGLPSIYVFDFDSISLGSVTINGIAGATAEPIALLSRSTMAFTGTDQINMTGVGGYLGAMTNLNGNGPGGGTNTGEVAGGGGFGGAGGAAASFEGAGGLAYGNLFTALQGGSAGGKAGIGQSGGAVYAGGGGGGLELGAVTSIAFSSATTISVNGLNALNNGGGGGSGGGLFIHAPTIVNPAGMTVLAAGGGGHAPATSATDENPGGGGGGGGRVAYQVSNYTAGSLLGNVSLTGGVGGAGNTVGSVTSPAGLTGSVGVMALHADTTTVPSGQLFNFDPSTSTATVTDFQTTNLAVQTGGAAVWVGDYANPGSVATQTGGVFSVTGSITNAGTSNFAMAGGVIVSGGTISLFDSASISGYGTVVGALYSTSAAASIVASGATLVLGDANSTAGVNFDGTILVNSTAAVPATLQLQDASQAIIGNGSIGPYGTLQAPNGITLSANRTLSGAANSSISGPFSNQGTVAGPATAGDFLTFVDDVDGAGSYTGNVKFLASFSPGNSPAAVSLVNGVFAPTTHLEMQLFGVMSGSQYDQLDVTGSLSLAGTLDVTLINGFVPAVGDSFTLILGNAAGAFSAINLPTLPEDESWSLDATTNGFTISVVPEPTSGGIVAAIGASFLRRHRRRRVMKI